MVAGFYHSVGQEQAFRTVSNVEHFLVDGTSNSVICYMNLIPHYKFICTTCVQPRRK